MTDPNPSISGSRLLVSVSRGTGFVALTAVPVAFLTSALFVSSESLGFTPISLDRVRHGFCHMIPQMIAILAVLALPDNQLTCSLLSLVKWTGAPRQRGAAITHSKELI